MLATQDLSNIIVRLQLAPRPYPYWHPVLLGRHLGFYRSPLGQTSWIARYKRKDGGYRQFRIGGTDEAHTPDGKSHLSFDQALVEARNVFSKNATKSIDPDPPRVKLADLSYCPVGSVYTLGHAMKEYLEWKKLSSAESHVYVIVTLLNRHLLPRLGTIGLEDLNTEHFFLAPHGTPQAIVDRLSKATQAALARDDVKKRLVELGYAHVFGGPAEAKARIAKDVAFYRQLIANAKIPQIQ